MQIKSRPINGISLRFSARRRNVACADLVAAENGERNVYRPGIGGVVGGGGVLASTGANATWWIVFGVVTVITGVVLMRLAHHRPQGN
jgi:hypothetical protein